MTESEQEPTSRIIVKNLPKHIDEERVRAHFSQKGSITDVRLLYTPRGEFRKFAFVGYSNPFEAASAAKYFDRTFIDTSRIEVNMAKAVGDETIPRPWSRYTFGSSQNTETQLRAEKEAKERSSKAQEKANAEIERKRAFLSSIYEAEHKDPQLAKYLEAIKPKSKTKTWENDGDLAVSVDQKQKQKKVKKASVSAVPNKKPGGQGQLVTKTHVTYSSADEAADVLTNSSDDDLYEDYIPAKHVDSGSDIHSDIMEDDTSVAKKEIKPVKQETKEEKKQLKPELITETKRLFVRNLAFTCTEQDLFKLFEKFGPVEEVHLSLSKETKRPKGFAYISFVQSEAALKAYRSLDGSIFQGRLLHVLPGEAKPVSKVDSAITNYKDKKLAKQKAEAGSDFNWNSLFVRSDTVLDSIASQLGVSKAEIMNPSSDNLAIRLATAETHLINDTKKALEREGVCLDVFEGGVSGRSSSVILVKNLPFDTDRSEIVKLFGKFGPLGRTILPPTKAIALVEYLESSDAKSAFRTLAYSKFHSVPLFLEFAPQGILHAQTAPEVLEPVKISENLLTKEEHVEGVDTLYVKNINFDTKEATLLSVFSEIGPVKTVTIPRKRDPKKPDAGLLSMGFAFVQFEKSEFANLALDRLQGTLIDNHAILLKRSSNTLVVKTEKSKRINTSSVNKDPANTCLMIRNIPFEASEREVRELFKSFAQVKGVRVPKKFDGGHRGFGFVDFVNSQEARNALESLAHTHLYGRHLVIEWADKKDGKDELDALRDRAAKNVSLVNMPIAKDIGDSLNIIH